MLESFSDSYDSTYTWTYRGGGCDHKFADFPSGSRVCTLNGMNGGIGFRIALFF